MGRPHSTTGSTTHRRAAAVALVALLGLAACGGEDDASNESVEAEMASEEEAMEAPAEFDATESGDDAIRTAGDGVASPATGGNASASLPIEDFGRDIIRSVGLTMLTSDVRQTSDDIRRVTAANGGAVFGSDVSIDEPRDDGSVPGGGQITIKIPPADLDRLVTALDGVGTVSRLSQDSDDVTDQLVDLEIRIRQAETSIERIEALLENATELDDVFAIETDLADRLVALERLRASQRTTENLVSLATVNVQIEYRSPATLTEMLDEPGDGIGDAFRSGWDAFLGAMFAIGFVLAVSSPFIIALIVLSAIAWLLTRRLQHRSAMRNEDRRTAADRPGAPAPVQPPAPVPGTMIEAGREQLVGVTSDGDATPAE